jgi:hypothetical protein
MPRYFTLAEAEALLPSVERQIRQAVHLKQEHDAAQNAQQEFQRKVAFMGGMQVDRSKLLAVRAKSDATVSRLNEILAEVNDLGVQVKDLDTGLIDFPTFYHGDEVLLCWKLGEDAIRYWHNLTEGFRGRREIDEDFVRNHRNHE